MVEEAIRVLGIDLQKELTLEHRQAIARTAGLELNQVKGAVERLRTTGGIKTRTRPQRRPHGQPLPDKPAPSQVKPPAREATPAPVASQPLARTLAVEIAGDLLQAARDTEGERREEMLLQAGALLNRVL